MPSAVEIKRRIGLDLFARLLEDLGAKVNRRERRSNCVAHGGDNPTALHYGLEDDVVLWNCFTSEPRHGGSVIDLVKDWRGIDCAGAVAWLSENYFGETQAEPPKKETKEPNDWREVRRKRYQLRDAAGVLILTRDRVEYVSREGKTRKAFYPNPEGLHSADYPLYGSERVKDWDRESPVIITEGEKACDALSEHAYHALGTATGSAETPSSTVLQVLAGRHVVLWPDNDDKGRSHMERICQRLQGVAASVRVLSWGEQEKDDAFDFFERGGKVEQLDQLLSDAREFEPPPKPGAEARVGALRTRADWRRDPPKPPVYLVESVIRERGKIILAGPPKSGKSLLSRQLGRSLSAGTEWLGFECRSGRVLIVDEENGEVEEHARALHQDAANPAWTEAEAEEGFGTISLAGFRLDDPGSVERLIELVKPFKPDLIFGDSLRRLHGGEENESKVSAEIIRAVDRIRSEVGCAFGLVHHVAKNFEGEDWLAAVRGSGDWTAGVDYILGLWVRGERRMLRGRGRGPEIEPFALDFSEETFTFARSEGTPPPPVARTVDVRASKVAAIVREKGAGGLLKLEEILKALLPIGDTQGKAAVRRAVELGLVEKDSRGYYRVPGEVVS